MTIIITIIILLICLLFFYLYVQDNYLSVSKHIINNKKITEEFNNFKIAHISDFHNLKSKYLINGIIENLRKEKPDIIVITGDLIHQDNNSNALFLISKIKDISKIYYVRGNHEKRSNNYSSLQDGLIKNGVIILNNQKEEIKINNKSINIVGVDDPYNKRDKKDTSNVLKSINNINYDRSKFTVLLCHRPELFFTYVKSKVDLVFTGHAHGGQVRVPFIGGLYAPNQGILPKYTNGLYQKDNTSMIVSRGLGNSGFPFRVNNRPNLIYVILKGD
jgi:predicted MPP superfamily phosphohydrolase